MTMNKEAEIVKLLADGTASGKQKWEPTASEEVFATTVGGGFGVTIRSVLDPQNPSDPDILIELRDREGRVVASVLNKTEGLDYRFLFELYSAARRSALKVDDTLDEMLKALKPK